MNLRVGRGGGLDDAPGFPRFYAAHCAIAPSDLPSEMEWCTSNIEETRGRTAKHKLLPYPVGREANTSLPEMNVFLSGLKQSQASRSFVVAASKASSTFIAARDQSDAALGDVRVLCWLLRACGS